MFNVINRETEIRPHIHNFNRAWTTLCVLEQTQLIEEFRSRIVWVSWVYPDSILSASAYLWNFRISLLVLGCIKSEFSQFFASYHASPVHAEIGDQISTFFEGILPINDSPSVWKLVATITVRITEALQK